VSLVILTILLQNVAASGLREGLLALNRGDLAVARDALESASQQEPENATAWAALAQVYFKSRRKADALNAARKAEQFGPDNAAVQHALAMFYAGEGEPGKAAGFERKFAARSHADRNAFLRAARFYLEAGDVPHAIETAEDGLKQTDNAELHHLLAQAYAAEKQPAHEIGELSIAARMAPDSEEASFNLAQALLRSERFAEAAAALEGFEKRFPSSPQIRLTLGVAYYGLRRFPEAVEAFLKTIDLAPDVEQPYLFLGRMLDQAGDRLPVIQARAEQFRSRHADSYLGSFVLAKALALNGGNEEQIELLLRDTIAKNPGFWEAHAELAGVLSRKHDYAGAAMELERSAKLNGSEPSIPFRLARVYDRLHQIEKATEQRQLHKRLLNSSKAGMGAEKP